MAQPDSRSTFQFGEFELNISAYELRRSGQPVHLERQPMDLLILLVERHRQLVWRADIVKRLWDPGVFIDVEMGVNTAIRKLRQALRDSKESPSFIETVSGKGYRFIAPVTSPVAGAALQASAQSESRMMLAVLPFENYSSDPDQEYFSDGLTEETISHLGGMNPERMGVIARTSSMAYKRTTKSVRQIGAELGVDYILESSVRREDNQVRITSQLIRVEDQTHIWTSNYDRDVTSVFAIQRELSAAIARHVGLQLLPERPGALAGRQTGKVEAHDAYLRGRYFWNQLSAVTTKRAMEYYGRAVELDPEYALAWSGMADAYATSPVHADKPPLQVWPRAREAVAHATASGPELPEVHTSLGLLKFWLDWDWVAAEAAYRKSIALDPCYSPAHRFLGIVLSHMARHDEASMALRQARDLDPLNATNHALSAQVAFAARDYSVAVQFAQQAITIDPEFWVGYIQLAQASERVGNSEIALDALNNAGRFSSGNSKLMSIRGYICARLGKAKEAHEALHTLEAVSRERYVPPYATALVYLGLGQHDSALQWLERAYDAHDVHLAFPPVDPKWDPLRADGRFADLLGRCGFLSLLATKEKVEIEQSA
jgi:TolB-like protein/Flp pilus assembly protein TadD